MSDAPIRNPIPASHREAFQKAVINFENWDMGGPEPSILLEWKPFTIDGICIAVEPFFDRAPDHIYDKVCDLAEGFRGGQEGVGHTCDGPKDHSYASVAQCLYRLYYARKDYYQRKELQRPRDGA